MKLTTLIAIAGLIVSLMAGSVQAEESSSVNNAEVVDCFYLATSDHPICKKP